MSATATSQPGLFTQLQPLLEHRAVLITISKLEGDQLQVNICPRQLKEGENSALTIPLCVTGTAAVLDVELVTQISSFVASHAGLNTNLAAIEREIAGAEKAAREEAGKKHKVGGKKASENVSSAAAATSPRSDPEPQKLLSPFDQHTQTTVSDPAKAFEGSDAQTI